MSAPRILIAGVGNIFHGDDGFGVEVARRLHASELPAGVRIVDFGIRAFDLAYALRDGYDTVILVDAVSCGGAPGTLYVIEPQVDRQADAQNPPMLIEPHRLNPTQVLRWVQALDGHLPRVLLVGCEPALLAPEEDGEDVLVGLSEPVATSVEAAIEMIRGLVAEIQSEGVASFQSCTS